MLGCVDVRWSRLGLGGTGRSGAWLLQGSTGKGEKKEKQCYNLQGMGTFSHRYVGGTMQVVCSSV